MIQKIATVVPFIGAIHSPKVLSGEDHQHRVDVLKNILTCIEGAINFLDLALDRIDRGHKDLTVSTIQILGSKEALTESRDQVKGLLSGEFSRD